MTFCTAATTATASDSMTNSPPRAVLALAVLLPVFGMTGVSAASAQDVGRPPPATNLQPQIVGPTTVNPAPPAPAASGVPTGDFFTLGAPLAPIGNRLANAGIFLKGFFESTLYAVPSGGVRNGNVLYDEAFYGADFDLQKMAGVPGMVIHLSLDSRFGGFPQGVNNFTGSTTGYLQGTGPSNKTRLNEFDIDQHLFDDKLRFVVGRTTLANYFATSELYCQFQVGICSNLGPFTWSGDSNSPFWPIAVWAGEVSFWPTKHLYIRAGASEDDVYQYPRAGFPWNGGWSTSHATGVFVPVEAGIQTSPEERRYPFKYNVGFTYDSSDFADPRYNSTGGLLAFSGGTPANLGSVTTVYAQARQMVWRPNRNQPQGVDLIGGLQIQSSGHALVQSYVLVGAVTHGTLPSRPNDSLGLLFQHYLFDGRQTGHVNDELAAAGYSGNTSRAEENLELNYGLEVAPGIQFKPYVDYTWHPDQNLFDVQPKPNVNGAFATGMQFSLLLNQAFGLPSYFRDN